MFELRLPGNSDIYAGARSKVVTKCRLLNSRRNDCDTSPKHWVTIIDFVL
jgi:hypothetical protein